MSESAPPADDFFHIYKTGQMTVIGFAGVDATRPDHIDEYIERIMQLVNTHQCQDLVVDLSGVGVISSWILGLLAYVQKQGPSVHLYHASDEIRDVLEITRIDQLVDVREGLAEYYESGILKRLVDEE